jgi:hypothetical protein
MKALLLAVTMAAAIVACGEAPVDKQASPTVIPIATQPRAEGEIACMTALLEGTLVQDARTGLGVAGRDGPVVPVIWPNGWVAIDGVPVTLVAADGRVVARVGDRIALGGGMVPPGETWLTCPTDIKVGP